MSDKLNKLRSEMKKRNVSGFFIPRADEFQGEYVPACAERLEWITGFTGSAGSAVVLATKAGFFTDGRYTLQGSAQVDAADFDICNISENQHPIPTMTPYQWIERNLGKGDVFGIDPWLHSPNEAARIRAAAEKAGGTLAFLDSNPLDAAWGAARPAKPMEPAVIHPLEFSGTASADKRHAVAAQLAAKDCTSLAVTLPEEICWLLNVRGNDVPKTPFVLSYALAHANGKVDWFVDAAKIDDAVRQWMGADVTIHPIEDFKTHLEHAVASGKVWVDPASAPVAVENIISAKGGSVHAERSPIQLMKACKNAVEIAGTKAAHQRDGIAVTRFLSVLASQSGPANLDEITAADKLEAFRAEGKNFKGLSFDTISGAGGNGAIVHYRADTNSNKPLLAGPVYLVDSGAQYLEGTTDITRTVAVDQVNEEMRDRYTRVLKGHIQVSLSRFPEGTTGDVLDVKARAALKEIGLDYAHGTGHGVGSYLSVHEGPAGISPRSNTVPLMPGMILSNEPGYYKSGEYGIRIENLLVVVDTGEKNADGKRILGFETLTLAPIDQNLIAPALLTAEEIAWLNDYHARVRRELLPDLKKIDAAAADYLIRATEPLVRNGGPASKNGPKP